MIGGERDPNNVLRDTLVGNAQQMATAPSPPIPMGMPGQPPQPQMEGGGMDPRQIFEQLAQMMGPEAAMQLIQSLMQGGGGAGAAPPMGGGPLMGGGGPGPPTLPMQPY